MFSGFELTVIKSWALTGKDILIGHLQSEVFTHDEKEDKRREYNALESIIDTAKTLQTKYANVDADHMGHMIFVLDEYKHYVKELLDTAEISTEDYAAECYAIGYIQGRAEIGLLSEKDINIISEWENTLEESNYVSSEE